MYSSNLRRPLLEVRDDQLTIKLVVKNFLQFPVFVFDPIPKSENAESTESFIKFLSTLSLIFTN